MDQIKAMAAFVRCVERGSFSAVARELNTTQPTISKLISSLERQLGGKLFARGTRHLHLTDEGQRYYEQCKAILDALDNAKVSFKSGREEVSGLLRVATAVAFGRTQVVPRLKAFLQRYPLLKVHLQLSDRLIDLIEEGIDVAFRINALKDSGLIARRLGSAQRVAVATPAYFKQFGEPRKPADLKHHDCIVYIGLAKLGDWTFIRKGRSEHVQVNGRLQTDSSEALREAALSGIGITMAPIWLFADDIRAKLLKVTLADYQSEPIPIHAVSPVNRRYSAKVRAFVDFFQAEFDRDPYVSGHGEDR